MSRSRIGEQTACRFCGHDIEFHGREHGWVDRGNGRSCLPFTQRGETITPTTKHAPPLSASTLALHELRRDEASEQYMFGCN